MRFILIAFAFMAWAFYELSGGSDFDADAVRAARMAELELEAPDIKAVRAQAEPVSAEPVVIEPASKVFVDTDPPAPTSTNRVSLNLTTLQTEPKLLSDTQTTNTAENTTTQVSQNVSTLTSSRNTPAIIPSLIDPTDGVTETETEQATTQVVGFQDIRVVSGNRVNVRGGPGTDFGIVGRLGRGDEVTILEDNGAGWVRFETQNGNTSGWMADFLLTNG